VGIARYRGPIDTFEQALWAHAVLTITCQRCSRSASMWAYKLRGKARGEMPMKRAVSGFYCKGCHRKVQVVMTADASR
jgi:hypothetical protein